jgi:hypothetical protein
MAPNIGERIMSQTVQRVRYFDGEFLQSGDFTDEQSYHIAMRRLLNLKFHLHGIVTGAEIIEDQTSTSTVKFYSVAPGFVIDQVGREIYVSAPYSLTPLLTGPGIATGWYEVWIVYTEAQSNPAAAGYQLCNRPSQDTRWTESFNIVLRELGVPPKPNVPNPNHDLKGICLGVLQILYDALNGWHFSLPTDWFRRRIYAKIRAQSIIAPDEVDYDSYTFYGPLASPQVFPPPPLGYVHIRTPNGVYSDGSMLVQENLLIGNDFTLDPTNLAVTGLPSSPLPSATGNVKVFGDVFINGTLFYQASANNWVALGGTTPGLQDIQFIPSVSKPAAIKVPIGGNVGAFLTAPIIVQTTLPNFSSVDVLVSIAGFEFVHQNNTPWGLGGVAPTDFTGLGLSTPGVNIVPTSGTSTTNVNITVSYDVAGYASGTTSLFNTVDIALVIVFRP